jgi:hypothetical protein
MKLLLRLSLVTSAALGALGCATAPSGQASGSSADATETPAAICAVRSPCGAVVPPTAEEVAACEAVFGDLEAPCRAENAALFVCSLRVARCTDAGEIDEEASVAALEAECLEAQVRFEQCCAEGDESVHCELLRQEAEEPGPTPELAPEEEAPEESPASN